MSRLTIYMEKPDLFAVWLGTQPGRQHGFCIGGGKTESDACQAASLELKTRLKELQQRQKQLATP